MSPKFAIPSTTTSSSTTTTTTAIPYTCRYLIRELIDGKNILENNLEYLENYFSLKLDKGLATSNCDICCPTCKNIYFLVNQFLFENLNSAGGPFNDCCLNIAQETEQIQCSDTQFSSCLQQLETIIGTTNYNTLLSEGVIEYSTIFSKTTICEIIEELKLSPVYSATLLFNAFSVIMEKGIVVYCDNGISTVSSVNSIIEIIFAPPALIA